MNKIGEHMKDITPFRNWVRELWYQHQDECKNWRVETEFKDVKEYFNKYKYWLKREFKYRQNIERLTNERRKRFENWS
jgi:hypothetical protein